MTDKGDYNTAKAQQEFTGEKVAELLTQQGLQSPVKVADKKLRDNSSRNRKLEVIGYHFSKIMEALELDLEDLGVKETPERVA